MRWRCVQYFVQLVHAVIWTHGRQDTVCKPPPWATPFSTMVWHAEPASKSNADGVPLHTRHSGATKMQSPSTSQLRTSALLGPPEDGATLPNSILTWLTQHSHALLTRLPESFPSSTKGMELLNECVGNQLSFSYSIKTSVLKSASNTPENSKYSIFLQNRPEPIYFESCLSLGPTWS